MLILQRDVEQSIVIGNDIVVMITKVRGDKVWLGIQAPRDTPVHRSEVTQAIREEQGLPPIELPGDIPARRPMPKSGRRPPLKGGL